MWEVKACTISQMQIYILANYSRNVALKPVNSILDYVCSCKKIDFKEPSCLQTLKILIMLFHRICIPSCLLKMY